MGTEIFQGYYTSLEKIAEFIEETACQAGLDSNSLYQIKWAVDEACTNIIEHAYGGEGLGNIHCSCLTDADKITILLQDQGKPFDPAVIIDPDLCCPLEERQIGGLGLYLIKKFMDEVQFEFKSDYGNTLKLVKYINQGPSLG